MFSGGDSSTKGLFHESEGGPESLVEVRDLAPEAQQMYNNAIQERRIAPVGD